MFFSEPGQKFFAAHRLVTVFHHTPRCFLAAACGPSQPAQLLRLRANTGETGAMQFAAGSCRRSSQRCPTVGDLGFRFPVSKGFHPWFSGCCADDTFVGLPQLLGLNRWSCNGFPNFRTLQASNHHSWNAWRQLPPAIPVMLGNPPWYFHCLNGCFKHDPTDQSWRPSPWIWPQRSLFQIGPSFPRPMPEASENARRTRMTKEWLRTRPGYPLPNLHNLPNWFSCG